MRAVRLRVLAALGLLFLAACQAPGTHAPLSLESRLRLAEASGGPGELGRLAMLREASRARPQDVELLAQLALAAERAGRFAEAAEAHRGIMQRETPSERRLTAIGRLLLRAGDGEGAVRAFEQGLALAPRSVEAAAGLGLAHDMSGNRTAAQQAYRRGLDVSPTDWTLRSNLGMSLTADGQPREAIPVLADAEFMPNLPAHSRHNLALALAADGQLDRATRVLRADMGQEEARVMAQEMSAFSRWLAPGLAVLPGSTVQPLRPVAQRPRPASGGLAAVAQPQAVAAADR